MEIEKNNPAQLINNDWQAEFTLLKYDIKIGKTYTFDGQFVKSETTGNGYKGYYKTINVDTMARLCAVQENMTLHQCLIAGTSFLGEIVGPLGAMENRWDYHTRTMGCFPDSDDTHQIVTVDIDLLSAPKKLQERLITATNVAELLYEVAPLAASGAILVRGSSSNGVLLPNGRPGKVGGWHLTLISQPGNRVEVMERLYAAFASAGYAWIEVSSAGYLLKRNVVDLALKSPNQPIFSAIPNVEEPLQLKRPHPFIQEGNSFDPDWLPAIDSAEVDDIYNELKAAPEVKVKQQQMIHAKANVLIGKKIKESTSPAEIIRLREVEIERLKNEVQDAERGYLGPDFIIVMHPTQVRVSVSEILRNVDRYDQCLTLTPGEEDYHGGAQTGKLYLNGDNKQLYTQAHGGKTYTLLPLNADKLIKSTVSSHQETLKPLFPYPKYVSLEEAQNRIDTILQKRWMKVEKRIGIHATMGIGKTRNVIKFIDDKTDFRVLLLFPTQELFKEAYSRYFNSQDGSMVFGRMSKNMEGHNMCLDHGRVKRVIAVHGATSINRHACNECPYFSECNYQKQAQQLEEKPPRVVFATHDYAHVPIPGGWTPDAVVIDEALRTGGIDDECQISSRSLSLNDQLYPQAALEQHLQNEIKFASEINSLSNEEIKAHRFRGEVLKALAHNEVTYECKGVVVVPKVKPYLYRDLPLLHLDGTLRRELAELHLGKFDNVYKVEVKRNALVVQVVGQKFNIGNLRGKDGPDLKQYLLRFIKVSNPDAVITYMSLRKDLGHTESTTWGHFGAIRGKANWENSDKILTIGQQQFPNQVYIGHAKALAKHYELDDVQDPHELISTERGIRMSSGQIKRTYVPSHADWLVRELMESQREDELIQAIDRTRSVRSSEPKTIIILSQLALDIDVDEVLEWKDIKQGRTTNRVNHAIMTGVIPDSPEQAVNLRPDTWNSKTTAARDYKNWLAPHWRTVMHRCEQEVANPNTQRKRIIAAFQRGTNCPWSIRYKQLMKNIFG